MRDVLGYTLPGVVTLLALALLWLASVAPETNGCWSQLLDVWKNFRWPIVAALLPLGFVVGHLQVQIIRCFEERRPHVPGWVLGKLALRYLFDPDEKMCHAYREAALELFDREGKLREHLTDRNLSEDLLQKDDDAELSAKALWRLCDYYVLVQNANTHATYMGRYYVLAVLFSNLGLSAMVLALCVAAVLSPSIRQWSGIVATAGIPGIVFLLVFRLSRRRRKNADERARRDKWLRGLDITLISLAIVALLGASVFPRQVLPSSLLLLGLVMIYWSGRFRRQFVERAFPIFYVLRQPTLQSRRGRPTPGWRAWLSTGIGGVALGYWLRGRTTRKPK